MALPPAGYSISKGAYFTDDGQGPYAWDGANMRLLGLGGLGTFTWAALQAAYPNGGGALAALPAGATAFVSDWGTEFTPNAAKTYWKPVSGRVNLGYHVCDLTTFLATLSGTGVTQIFVLPSPIDIPANLLQVGCRIGHAMLAKRTALAGAPVAAQIRVHVGSGVVTDAIAGNLNISPTLNQIGSIYQEASVVTGTLLRRLADAQRISLTALSSFAVDSGTNFNITTAMTVSFMITGGFIAGDTVQLYEAGVWVVFP